MIGYIISCLATFELICALEFVATRVPGNSATIISDLSYVSIPIRSNKGLSEVTSASGRVSTSEKAFQLQNTSLRVDRTQPPQPLKHSLKAASCEQDRKSPRLFLSRLIIVSMNQNSRVSGSGRVNVINSSNAQNNYLDDEKITLTDENQAKRVETNTVSKLPNEAFYSNTNEQSYMENFKASQDKSKKGSSNTTSVEVTLDDRSSFVGDGCPTGYAKVNGKCVPVSE